jgi:hypothetical protein
MTYCPLTTISFHCNLFYQASLFTFTGSIQLDFAKKAKGLFCIFNFQFTNAKKKVAVFERIL